MVPLGGVKTLLMKYQEVYFISQTLSMPGIFSPSLSILAHTISVIFCRLGWCTIQGYYDGPKACPNELPMAGWFSRVRSWYQKKSHCTFVLPTQSVLFISSFGLSLSLSLSLQVHLTAVT